jgi:hypothetical protein
VAKSARSLGGTWPLLSTHQVARDNFFNLASGTWPKVHVAKSARGQKCTWPKVHVAKVHVAWVSRGHYCQRMNVLSDELDFTYLPSWCKGNNRFLAHASYP